ncbi:MAG: histidine kinase [Proteobacteria bacterium]|nr:histidine kinase [Pseudomonadota bacterium]
MPSTILSEQISGGDGTLLRGISWRGFALVALLFGIWSLQLALSPTGLIASGVGSGLLVAWVSLWIAVLVGGFTLFVASVVALNLAFRAGIDSAWIVLPVALVGSLAAALIGTIAGAAPHGLNFGVGNFSVVAFWADWAMAIAVGYLVIQRIAAAREDTQRIELQRTATEVRHMGARLTVLEAQIEPHFLFNTLSNIRRLCQQDLTSGRNMLAHLSRYLRAALPKMRRDHASLGDEVELVMAYLELQKIRMGERLSVLASIPDEHRRATVPTMMLVTLVENAIKHGLAPLPDGGSIAITSVREGECLSLTVTDTGRGFAAGSGNGVGLSNIRARLTALYGNHASLRLAGNQPRGVQATIDIPWSEEDCST